MAENKDRKHQLYEKSKVHLKQNKTSEEYEFEKNAAELTFTPQTNKYKVDTWKPIEERVYEINAKKHERISVMKSKTIGFVNSNQVYEGNAHKTPVGGKDGS